MPEWKRGRREGGRREGGEGEREGRREGGEGEREGRREGEKERGREEEREGRREGGKWMQVHKISQSTLNTYMVHAHVPCISIKPCA